MRLLNKYLLTLFFLSCMFVNTALYSEQIFKWVDEDGVSNYSNLQTNLPKDFYNSGIKTDKQKISVTPDLMNQSNFSKIELEQKRKDYFYRLKQQEEQRKLLREIREIVEKEKSLKEEYKVKQILAIETKREFDKRIIQGYFADKSILELKQFETDMENISYELESLKPKKRDLISIARKKGIEERLY